MEKGIYYDNENIKKEIRGVYYDNTVIESLPNEYWLPIFEYAVPNVQPYYYISNMGRIYSTQYKNGKGGFKSIEPDYSGYVKSGLMKTDKSSTNIGNHRLVMLSFNPISDPDNYVVNHKDGNKSNNNISNLEWCTYQENVQHAYDTNLNAGLKGERNVNAKHTEEFVRKICEGLEKGLNLTECANYVGIDPTRDNRRYISRIKRGDLWTHVSSEYNIPQESYGTKRKFSNSDLHKICWMIQDGLSDKEILDNLIPNIKGVERSKYQKTIYKVRNKIAYNDITDFYEF